MLTIDSNTVCHAGIDVTLKSEHNTLLYFIALRLLTQVSIKETFQAKNKLD